MAWTTPRTWSVHELVTAAHKNEQVRDNESSLVDMFDTATGHDHDGTDSKALASVLPDMAMVTWLPAAAISWYDAYPANSGVKPDGYMEDYTGTPDDWPSVFIKFGGGNHPVHRVEEAAFPLSRYNCSHGQRCPSWPPLRLRNQLPLGLDTPLPQTRVGWADC